MLLTSILLHEQNLHRLMLLQSWRKMPKVIIDTSTLSPRADFIMSDSSLTRLQLKDDVGS